MPTLLKYQLWVIVLLKINTVHMTVNPEMSQSDLGIRVIHLWWLDKPLIIVATTYTRP